MNPHDALADGRLSDAVLLQTTIVASEPSDPARLFLLELQALAGQFREAANSLNAIASTDPTWPASRKWYRRVLRCAHRRERGIRPTFVGDIPVHAKLRQRAIRAIRRQQPDVALETIDRAERRSPHIFGHVDGREFEGMRDADDRFASVFEAMIGREYVWLPFEQLRTVTFAPSRGWLERAYRPARIRLTDGAEFAAVLPTIYPGTAEDSLRLGTETDYTNPDGGPVRCVGGKLLLLGEEEIPLAEVHQIEIRGWSET